MIMMGIRAVTAAASMVVLHVPHVLNVLHGSPSPASPPERRPPLVGPTGDGPKGASCRGFLEATYTYKDAARWFLNHQPSTEPPYTTLNYSAPTGRFALDLIHGSLIHYHAVSIGTPTCTSSARPLSPEP